MAEVAATIAGGHMRGQKLILLGVALAIGLVAVILANAYFGGVQDQQERVAEQQRLSPIVVASQELAFGTPLGEQNLRIVNWPASSVPAGSFASVAEAARGGRVALRPIVVGEPVLASKISGADGRATLSANLPVGKLAYSVPITDVAGVGGFIRPGDVVDVLLTRQIPGEGATANDKMTDVIMEAAPVLGIDQVADEKNTNPTVGKTATLQVDAYGAQKLALGIQLGTISLALRNVADPAVGANATVLPQNLSASGRSLRIGARTAAQPPAAPAPNVVPQRSAAMTAPRATPQPRPSGPTMTVVRGSQPSEYEVQRGF